MEEQESRRGAVGAAATTFDAVGIPIITLTGEIDVSNVDSLRATIEPAVETAPDRVVFDVTGLDFMTAAASPSCYTPPPGPDPCTSANRPASCAASSRSRASPKCST
jgi:hypothetical protein